MKIFSTYIIYLLALLMTTSVMLVSCRKDQGPYYTSSVKTTLYDGNVIQYLESKPGLYDTMLVVLKRYPDLVKMLTSGDSMTIFAIPNSAFITAANNFNTTRPADSAKLYYASNNLNRADSGMFNYHILRSLISRYIFKGQYDYDKIVSSYNGYAIPTIQGYNMNMKAVQENSVGAVKSGPKVIELSDMNHSIFRMFWKSVSTNTISAVVANNVLVHTLPEEHEFGFASFTDWMKNPIIDRGGWQPISWHSIVPDNTSGGTVFHVFDGDVNTFWHSDYTNPIPPPPYNFTVDMKINTTIAGVGIQNRQDNHQSVVRIFKIEFALDTAKNLNDSASWVYSVGPFELPRDQGLITKPYNFIFHEKLTARYFRFTALDNFNGVQTTPFVNLAELWFSF